MVMLAALDSEVVLMEVRIEIGKMVLWSRVKGEERVGSLMVNGETWAVFIQVYQNQHTVTTSYKPITRAPLISSLHCSGLRLPYPKGTRFLWYL